MRPPADTDFTSRLRSAAVTARVGLWLGICFAIAFVTGLVSHYAQAARPAGAVPDQPVVGLPRHPGPARHRRDGGGAAAAGQALDGLPPAVHAGRRAGCGGWPSRRAERASIAVLVAAAVFQLATGLANSAQWYPWSFSFRGDPLRGGLDRDRRAGRARGREAARDPPGARRRRRRPPRWTVRRPPRPARSRGAGCCAPPGSRPGWPCWPRPAAPCRVLRRVSVLGVRSGDGPGGVPINKSARAAGRHGARPRSPSYRLTVAYAGREVSLSRDDLAAMPQATRSLPIACVEGWSAGRHLDRGPAARPARPRRRAAAGHDVRRGLAAGERPLPRSRSCQSNFADDDRTLLALQLNGEHAGHRPRLPVPADRARPSRRAADQVGPPAGGAGMTARVATGAVGVLLGVYGAWLLLSRQDPGRRSGTPRSGSSRGWCCTTPCSRRW